MKKIALIKKIDEALEKEILRTGNMGSESVSVQIPLTEEERRAFRDIDKYDNDHYFWEINDSELYIVYTEDVM